MAAAKSCQGDVAQDQPMALMLMQRDATVCICHAKTRDLAQFTILADILVIVGYIGWGFFRLNQAGVELTHLFATSAILTAVLAISMQDTHQSA